MNLARGHEPLWTPIHQRRRKERRRQLRLWSLRRRAARRADPADGHAPAGPRVQVGRRRASTRPGGGSCPHRRCRICQSPQGSRAIGECYPWTRQLDKRGEDEDRPEPFSSLPNARHEPANERKALLSKWYRALIVRKLDCFFRELSPFVSSALGEPTFLNPIPILAGHSAGHGSRYCHCS